jgi:hypothetical protein
MVTSPKFSLVLIPHTFSKCGLRLLSEGARNFQKSEISKRNPNKCTGIVTRVFSGEIYPLGHFNIMLGRIHVNVSQVYQS